MFRKLNIVILLVILFSQNILPSGMLLYAEDILGNTGSVAESIPDLTDSL